ncbi:hypothetical protein [Pseudoalteromonas sp. R3]|uniref:hypothetical protein n=1 Tax=Pseudoalteromonas sp. R3 TaxID=1709477 RepID=UPI0006B5065F|nr:hypothetical protein [Pseudoalteromonas sp. R3]AZZ99128.1 hypothetical protein ELR70_19700 [Pseudoalteromonas sp. R3]
MKKVLVSIYSTLLCVLVCIDAKALSIVCGKIESDTAFKELVIGQIQASEIVALVAPGEPTDTSTTKHKVLNVWKGVVGEHIYVSGGTNRSLLFTNRIEANGPLEMPNSYCGLDHDKALAVIRGYFGDGYAPSPHHIEKPYSSFLVDWPLVMSFMLLAVIGLYTYVFVRNMMFSRKK